MEARSSGERLIVDVPHDVLRLARVLRTVGCSATLCTADGTVVALTPSGCCAGAAESKRTRHRAPVYDDRGEPIASLEVSWYPLDTSEVVNKLVASLVEAAASSIAERWFRMCHRLHWILSAQCIDDPEKFMLLALDREQRVIAADWHARRLLASRGLEFDASVSMLTFFQASDSPINKAQYVDVTTTLRGAVDGAEWSAVITAPGVRVGAANGERTRLLQECSRVGTPGCTEDPGQPVKRRRGLPPRILSRIQEYVDSHLEETLVLDKLASVVGMSVSHFSRCFRRSVGLTPHGYVMRRRLLRAQALLSETDLKLAEIALKTGFADQSHFSHVFLQFTGTSPSRFRRRHRCF